MIVAIAAVVPLVFVVVPMVIAVIVTLTVTVMCRRNDTGRHNRHQSQQNACRNNAMHIRTLLNGVAANRVTNEPHVVLTTQGPLERSAGAAPAVHLGRAQPRKLLKINVIAVHAVSAQSPGAVGQTRAPILSKSALPRGGTCSSRWRGLPNAGKLL
jgi:hypothetical protein